jgi:hypothetical protein
MLATTRLGERYEWQVLDDGTWRPLRTSSPDEPPVGLRSDWRTSLSGTVSVAHPGWSKR